MTHSFQVLSTIAELDAALTRASSEPVVLFKHSETCGMSLQAHEEVRATLSDTSWTTPVYLVSVQAARPVSSDIERRLRVPHQSPQVLLVDGDKVRWHTSHLAITKAALRAAVDRCAVAR